MKAQDKKAENQNELRGSVLDNADRFRGAFATTEPVNYGNGKAVVSPLLQFPKITVTRGIAIIFGASFFFAAGLKVSPAIASIAFVMVLVALAKLARH